MPTQSSTNALPSSPATERNREPIREALTARLPASGVVLEIASGLGQHVVHFAAAFPGLQWRPTEVDPQARAVAAARLQAAGLDNVAAPVSLDVEQRPWPVASADAVVCINLVHVAAWPASEALLAGAGEQLPHGGGLFVYGPFREAGVHTAASNAAFDEQLRARNPQWGIRDTTRLADVAEQAGLTLEETVPMPANNRLLVFRRR